jgi:hypothetical protein
VLKLSLTVYQRFYLILYVVKAVPVMDLVKVLEMGKRITEDSVVSTSEFTSYLKDVR